METIEQIKQERDKLQERLNNAAKFFREQKTQIETLKNEVKEKTSLAMDYRNQIETLTKENEKLIKNEKKEITLDSSEEVLKENNELKIKLQNSEEAYEMLRKKYEERKNQITELLDNIEIKNNEYNELKELTDGDLKRYNELEDNYEGLQNKYQELENKFKENDIARGEAELKASNLQSEYTKKFEEQDKEIKKLTKEYEDTLHDLNVEAEAHKKDNEIKEKYEESLDELNKSNVELKDKLDKLNGDYLELKGLIAAKEQFNKTLQDTYNEVYGELNELKETNKKNVNYCEDLKKKYDDLENEKLAWEADYKNLEDKFNLLKENKEIDNDVLENVMDAISQIYQITDDILNPKPVDIVKDDDIKLQSQTNTQKGKKSPIGEKSNNFGLHDLGESAII